MPTYTFAAYEVDQSYYFSDAQSLILSRDRLEITDSVDDDLHRTVEEDPANDQTFNFANEAEVTDYTVQYLDFAQLNGSGPQYELYAMQVSFADGSTKYYVMSKDEGFRPDIGDDLRVTSFSNFTSTSYGQIGSAVCYTAGTRIRTAQGDVPVEQLRPGDLVQTADNGLKEIVWRGHRTLGAEELQRAPQLKPIVIRRGVLGNTAPLLVSPQHRLLIDGAACHQQSHKPEAYIRAKHLAEYWPKAARIAHGKREVQYHHILLDRHEVIFAEGAPSESLFLGKMALRGISRADRWELEALFGTRLTEDQPHTTALARPTLPRKAFSKGLSDISALRLKNMSGPTPPRRIDQHAA